MSASTLRQRYDDACDSVLLENSAVAWKWVATPFCSDTIVFNGNRIASIIAALTLTLGVNGPYREVLSKIQTPMRIWWVHTSETQTCSYSRGCTKVKVIPPLETESIVAISFSLWLCRSLVVGITICAPAGQFTASLRVMEVLPLAAVVLSLVQVGVMRFPVETFRGFRLQQRFERKIWTNPVLFLVFCYLTYQKVLGFLGYTIVDPHHTNCTFQYP